MTLPELSLLQQPLECLINCSTCYNFYSVMLSGILLNVITFHVLAPKPKLYTINYPLSVKGNGREPKTCLGRVFNYKLGCFNNVLVFIHVDVRPRLLLKTLPRFSPVS